LSTDKDVVGRSREGRRGNAVRNKLDIQREGGREEGGWATFCLRTKSVYVP